MLGLVDDHFKSLPCYLSNVVFPETVVDELKEDVSQLKLPKSYTPRL